MKSCFIDTLMSPAPFPRCFHLSVCPADWTWGVTSYSCDHSSRTVDSQFQTLRNEISGCMLSLHEIPLFPRYENVFQSTCSSIWVTEVNNTSLLAYIVGHYKLLVSVQIRDLKFFLYSATRMEGIYLLRLLNKQDFVRLDFSPK